MEAITKNWRLFVCSTIVGMAGCGGGESGDSSSPPPAATGWQRSVSEDRMRGTATAISSATSINAESFGFPYDGGARLIVRVLNAAEVTVEIERGQFTCARVCDLFISFDGSQPRMFVFRWPSDGRHNFLISRESQKLIGLFAKSTRWAIEATFYQEGNRQFFFEPGPLPAATPSGS